MNMDHNTFKTWWSNEGLYKIDSNTDVYTMALIAYCAGAQKGRSEVFGDFTDLVNDSLNICIGNTEFDKTVNALLVNLHNSLQSMKDIRDE